MCRNVVGSCYSCYSCDSWYLCIRHHLYIEVQLYDLYLLKTIMGQHFTIGEQFSLLNTTQACVPSYG